MAKRVYILRRSGKLGAQGRALAIISEEHWVDHLFSGVLIT